MSHRAGLKADATQPDGDIGLHLSVGSDARRSTPATRRDERKQSMELFVAEPGLRSRAAEPAAGLAVFAELEQLRILHFRADFRAVQLEQCFPAARRVVAIALFPHGAQDLPTSDRVVGRALAHHLL